MTKELNFASTTDRNSAYKDANYVVVAIPSNKVPDKYLFDTYAVESVVEQILSVKLNACIVIKTWLNLVFQEYLQAYLQTLWSYYPQAQLR